MRYQREVPRVLRCILERRVHDHLTETQTGQVKTYFNPRGSLANAADTSAF